MRMQIALLATRLLLLAFAVPTLAQVRYKADAGEWHFVNGSLREQSA